MKQNGVICCQAPRPYTLYFVTETFEKRVPVAFFFFSKTNEGKMEAISSQTQCLLFKRFQRHIR